MTDITERLAEAVMCSRVACPRDHVPEFWALIDSSSDGCWEWLGATVHGYGRFRPHENSRRMAHRIAWQLANAQRIPPAMVVDHLCKNTVCVRPAHLEVVTQRENVRRGDSIMGVNARKIRCHKGHPFDTANTYLRPGGERQCRECKRQRDRKRYKERSGAC